VSRRVMAHRLVARNEARVRYFFVGPGPAAFHSCLDHLWPVPLNWMTAGRSSTCRKRVGKEGRIFRVFKFRSMIVDAEKATGAVQATEHDPG